MVFNTISMCMAFKQQKDYNYNSLNALQICIRIMTWKKSKEGRKEWINILLLVRVKSRIKIQVFGESTIFIANRLQEIIFGALKVHLFANDFE